MTVTKRPYSSSPRVTERYHDPLEANTALVESQIKDDDVVLDVGGWWKPFLRADFVVDLLPFATRGGGGSIGHGPERFNPDRWIEQDICTTALPFGEKSIDFAYCGQTLEDVRDPLFVCRELQRVAMRGYIEVPSLFAECLFGADVGYANENYPGYEKHRWLVQIEDGSLTFIPKQVWMAVHPFLSEQDADRLRVRQELWTSFLVWDDSFEAIEMPFAGKETIIPHLERYFDDWHTALFDEATTS